MFTNQLSAHVGERVRRAGWLHHRRQLSRLTFLVLRDAGGLAQVVVDDDATSAQVDALLPETVIEVEGRAVASPQAPGGVEVHAPSVTVLATPAVTPPIELRRPELKEQLPTLLDHAPVALRHPCRRACFEVAAASLAGYRTALDAHGFTEIQTPKILESATRR